MSVFYYHSQKSIYPSAWSRVKYILFSLAVGIGLCINNARAVLEGLFSHAGEFKRTPKYAVVNKGDSWREKKYRVQFNIVSVIELAMVVHFTIALVYAIQERLFLSIPFVSLFLFGFSYAAFLSFFQGGLPKWFPRMVSAALVD